GLPGELGVAVDLGRVRRHLLLAERAQAGAKFSLDVGQGEGHRPILAEGAEPAFSLISTPTGGCAAARTAPPAPSRGSSATRSRGPRSDRGPGRRWRCP